MLKKWMFRIITVVFVLFVFMSFVFQSSDIDSLKYELRSMKHDLRYFESQSAPPLLLKLDCDSGKWRRLGVRGAYRVVSVRCLMLTRKGDKISAVFEILNPYSIDIAGITGSMKYGDDLGENIRKHMKRFSISVVPAGKSVEAGIIHYVKTKKNYRIVILELDQNAGEK